MQTQISPEFIDSQLSSRYQTVVPTTIRKALGLKAGDKISWQIVQIQNKLSALAQPKIQNWAIHTRGLGKHIWKNVDIGSYIKQLRNEWEG